MVTKIRKFFGRLKLVLKDPDFYIKYNLGALYIKDAFHQLGKEKTELEISKKEQRYDVINVLLKTFKNNTNYLEIGVRDPRDNFNKINADNKYSVDPGFENKENLVDFKFTSDVFFDKLNKNEILNKDIKFEVIFIDGSHLASQVEKDIKNSLKFIKDDGFIVLHDCNPPTNFHASELYNYRLSPSLGYWNGTTWKAFYKYRLKDNLYSCCIDTDWGIGIISKTIQIGIHSNVSNSFFEYNIFNLNRKESLGLISFEEFNNRFYN